MNNDIQSKKQVALKGQTSPFEGNVVKITENSQCDFGLNAACKE